MDYQKTYDAYQKYGMGKKFENLPEYASYKKELRGTLMARLKGTRYHIIVTL